MENENREGTQPLVESAPPGARPLPPVGTQGGESRVPPVVIAAQKTAVWYDRVLCFRHPFWVLVWGVRTGEVRADHQSLRWALREVGGALSRWFMTQG